MIAVEDVVLVLLAAGRSERFGGAGSKLDQDLLGQPMGLHVAVTLEGLAFRERIAVVGRAAIDFARHGFRVLHNWDAGEGLASSVRIGVACARQLEAQAVLIVLADMPRVTAAHIGRLLDAADGDDAVVASSDGVRPSPPALFGRERFDSLLSLDGDAGARGLLRAGKHVAAASAELIDVDTIEDLERLRALVDVPETRMRRAV